VRDQQTTSAAVVGGAADADFGNWRLEIGHQFSVDSLGEKDDSFTFLGSLIE
jgi:hypothetical protein